MVYFGIISLILIINLVEKTYEYYQLGSAICRLFFLEYINNNNRR